MPRSYIRTTSRGSWTQESMPSDQIQSEEPNQSTEVNHVIQLQSDGPVQSLADSGQPQLQSDQQKQSAGVIEDDGNASKGELNPTKMNQFEALRPLPKKDFGDNKQRRKSRATTSRVLTSKQHIDDLKNELFLSAEKKKPKKRKLNLQLKVSEDKHQIGSGSKQNKKSKKLTCREDKPRGRKPGSKNQKTQKKAHLQSVKKSKVNSVCCAGCGENEDDSVEDWIACIKCQMWYELSCAGMLGKPKHIQDSFLCGDCKQ